MTDTSVPDEQGALVEVLREHQWHHTRDTHCTCGFRTPLAELAIEGYLAHVVQAILAAAPPTNAALDRQATLWVEQIAHVLLSTKDPAGSFPVVRAGCAMAAAEAVVEALAARPVSAGPDEEGLRAGVGEVADWCADKEADYAASYRSTSSTYAEGARDMLDVVESRLRALLAASGTGRQGDENGSQEPPSGPRSDEQGFGDLLATLETILAGIDQDEAEDDNGWWETSTGAEFGAGVLQKIREAVRIWEGHRGAR